MRTTITLSKAQIEALGLVPLFEVLPAPGIGKFIDWDKITVLSRAGVTRYSCVDPGSGFMFVLGDPSGAYSQNYQSQQFDLATQLQATTDTLTPLVASAESLVQVNPESKNLLENLPLNLYTPISLLASGGDGTVDITVDYEISDI